MKNNNKEIILYNDDVINYIDNNADVINEYLKEYEMTNIFENRCQAASQLIDDDLYFLKQDVINFDNNKNYDAILITADLGLWYGRRAGQKKYNNLYDALFKYAEDQNKIFFKDKRCTLQLNASHHDGCNIFKFYKIKSGKKYAIKLNDLQ